MSIVILGIQAALILTLAFAMSKRETKWRLLFWFALITKLAAGVGIGILYSGYYPGGDTFSYYQDAMKLAAVFKQNFDTYADFLFNFHVDPSLQFIITDSRAFFFTKVLSVFMTLSVKNYWMLALYLSFFSFAGCWFFFKTIERYMPSLSSAAIVVCFLFPSFVFWSSGVLRESLSTACLFFLVAVSIRMWFDGIIWKLIIPSAIAAMLLWMLKYYFAAVLFAVLATNVLYCFGAKSLRLTEKSTKSVALWLTIFIGPALVVSLMQPNLHLDFIFQQLIDNYYVYVNSGKADIILPGLDDNIWSIIISIPNAFGSGLFRPFLWEAQSLLQVLAAIENLIVFLLMVIACWHLRIIRDTNYPILLVALFMYVLLLSVFIPMSTPNFGSLSRYRIGYVPFFMLIILSAKPLQNILQRSLARLVSNRG